MSFSGAINEDIRSLLSTMAPAWKGKAIYVGRSGNFTVKRILEEQQGWNDSRKLDQPIRERPKPLRFTEGHLECDCVREQSQAIWAGE
jgi:hypothetical protein